MKKILISANNIKLEAELYENYTAEKIWSFLPLEEKVNTWGDEIYFSIGKGIELEEDASEVVSEGDLAYWPSGKAFCIFFGPTPASQGDEIRAASAVNVFGKINGDATVLKKVASGTKISIQKKN
jgi:uncharacterized protein